MLFCNVVKEIVPFSPFKLKFLIALPIRLLQVKIKTSYYFKIPKKPIWSNNITITKEVPDCSTLLTPMNTVNGEPLIIITL